MDGLTRIITLELNKLDSVINKSIDEMNTQEFWAVFFRYLTDKKKRSIINEIVKREEGLAMASEVVMSISNDLEERLRLNSEEKAMMDYYSRINYARKEGREEQKAYFLELLDQDLSKEEIKQRLRTNEN